MLCSDVAKFETFQVHYLYLTNTGANLLSPCASTRAKISLCFCIRGVLNALFGSSVAWSFDVSRFVCCCLLLLCSGASVLWFFGGIARLSGSDPFVRPSLLFFCTPGCLDRCRQAFFGCCRQPKLKVTTVFHHRTNCYHDHIRSVRLPWRKCALRCCCCAYYPESVVWGRDTTALKRCTHVHMRICSQR